MHSLSIGSFRFSVYCLSERLAILDWEVIENVCDCCLINRHSWHASLMSEWQREWVHEYSIVYIRREQQQPSPRIDANSCLLGRVNVKRLWLLIAVHCCNQILWPWLHDRRGVSIVPGGRARHNGHFAGTMWTNHRTVRALDGGQATQAIPYRWLHQILVVRRLWYGQCQWRWPASGPRHEQALRSLLHRLVAQHVSALPLPW